MDTLTSPTFDQQHHPHPAANRQPCSVTADVAALPMLMILRHYQLQHHNNTPLPVWGEMPSLQSLSSSSLPPSPSYCPHRRCHPKTCSRRVDFIIVVVIAFIHNTQQSTTDNRWGGSYNESGGGLQQMRILEVVVGGDDNDGEYNAKERWQQVKRVRQMMMETHRERYADGEGNEQLLNL